MSYFEAEKDIWSDIEPRGAPAARLFQRSLRTEILIDQCEKEMEVSLEGAERALGENDPVNHLAETYRTELLRGYVLGLRMLQTVLEELGEGDDMADGSHVFTSEWRHRLRLKAACDFTKLKDVLSRQEREEQQDANSSGTLTGEHIAIPT